MVSIVADGHTKVHGYSVVSPRLEHRDTAGWSDWQVDIVPIQLRKSSTRQTDRHTWQLSIRLN